MGRRGGTGTCIKEIGKGREVTVRLWTSGPILSRRFRPNRPLAACPTLAAAWGSEPQAECVVTVTVSLGFGADSRGSLAMAIE
eukprot:432176-Rhodomonas_salina.1